jgi:hypothetical protein
MSEPSDNQKTGTTLQPKAAVIQGGQRVPTGDGGFGIFFDEHPDRERYRRWSSRQFTAQDELEASVWRELSRKVNIEKLAHSLGKKATPLGHPANLAETLRLVDKLLTETAHYQFLASLLRLFAFSEKVQTTTLNRWERFQFKTLDYFAPYCKHVLRVVFLYTIGLANSLITPKPTNVVDIEYLFYLPFCMVFSSGDKFVIEMAKVLLTPKQYFIERNDLKKDMRAVADYYDADCEKRKVLAQWYKGKPGGVFGHLMWTTINQLPWERPQCILASPESGEMYQKVSQIVKAIKDFKASGQK